MPILTPSQRADELMILASMIHEATAKTAAKIANDLGFSPRKMFIDRDLVDNFETLQNYGGEVFGGYLCKHQVSTLAFTDPTIYKQAIERIIATYKDRLSRMDLPLNQFETPAKDEDDPDCLFQGRWLRRGQCGAVVSTSGVGKSSLTMQAAVTWAAGEDFLGIHPMKPIKVGIFQSEDDEYDVANFRDRIRIGLTACYHWDDDKIRDAESRVTFCALDGSTGMRFVDHMTAKLEKHHFDLIIINPFFAFFGGDTNNASEVTEFLRHGIDRLIKNEATKCGCLIVHHTAKPNKDAFNNGDLFAAYLGSGSAEFVNYIRSALVLTPYTGIPSGGVFNLIAAKHGDKLGWVDDQTKAPTNKKTVCYANRIPELTQSGMIFWLEPTRDELAEMKANGGGSNAAGGGNEPLQPPTKQGRPSGNDTDETACANFLKAAICAGWGFNPLKRPTDAIHGQKRWVRDMSGTGFTRRLREVVYEQMMEHPDIFGLSYIQADGTGMGGDFLVAKLDEPAKQDDFPQW